VREVTADESRGLMSGETVDFNFDEVVTRELRIDHRGYSWSRTRNATDEHWNISHRRIEILSPDFPGGVFKSFYDEHRGQVDFELQLRRFVQVRARDFDLEELHEPTNRAYVYTNGGGQYAFVQIDFLDKQFVTSCYRLHRGYLHPREVARESRGEELHAWSLRGSNDLTTPTGSWTILHHYRDEEPGAGELFGGYPAIGGPYRYLRLCVDEPIWNSTTWYEMQLKHLELYGALIDVA
jgi:hypothetical protein